MKLSASITAAFVTAVLWAPVSNALVIAYEWAPATPGTNSRFNSFHNATGPVLADDFSPSIAGNVVQVDWWGSQGIGLDQWEITFHADNPVGTPSFPFLSQHFVNAAGTDPDGDGVFFFSSAWTPSDVSLVVGTDYWFSVANGSTNNWLWANPGGAAPSVGSEQYDALQSVGGPPSVVAGPHDGPWNPTVAGQDFAFRIWVDAPEPGTLGLLGLAVAGVTALRRRRRSAG